MEGREKRGMTHGEARRVIRNERKKRKEQLMGTNLYNHNILYMIMILFK